MLLEAYAQITFVHIFAQSLFGISLSSGLAYLFGGHFQRICITGVCFYWGPLVTLNGKTSFLSDEVMRKSWQSVHIGYGFYLPSGSLARIGRSENGPEWSGQRIIQTVQVLLCILLLLSCLARTPFRVWRTLECILPSLAQQLCRAYTLPFFHLNESMYVAKY